MQLLACIHQARKQAQKDKRNGETIGEFGIAHKMQKNISKVAAHNALRQHTAKGYALRTHLSNPRLTVCRAI